MDPFWAGKGDGTSYSLDPAEEPQTGRDAPVHIHVFVDARLAPACSASPRRSAWKGRQQSIVVISTAESEPVAAAEAHPQARDLALLMEETKQSLLPSSLAGDDTAAVSMVGDRTQDAWRIRNISIR